MNVTEGQRILETAYDLLKKRGAWVKGYYALDKFYAYVSPNDETACRFCAKGAILRACRLVNPDEEFEYSNHLDHVFAVVIGDDIVEFNDDPKRTKRQVLDALEKTRHDLPMA